MVGVESSLYVSPCFLPWTRLDLRKLASSSACWIAAGIVGSEAGREAFSLNPPRICSRAAVRVRVSPTGRERQGWVEPKVYGRFVKFGSRLTLKGNSGRAHQMSVRLERHGDWTLGE